MVALAMTMWCLSLVSGMAFVVLLFVVGYHFVMRYRQAMVRQVSRQWWETECSRLYCESENVLLSEDERMQAFRQWQEAERQRMRVALLSLSD